MTHTAHTQKSLDGLTWNEIQKLHTSLGLKATAESRSRRDYQRRIVATQPQAVVEPEAVATPLTCAACPLARLIDGDRYCCGLTNNVTRGHWEANTDCYDAVAEAQTETETMETVAEVEAPIAQIETAPQEITVQPQPAKTELTTATTTDDAPPNRGDNGRGRVEVIAPAIAPRIKIKQPPIWAYVPPNRVQETIMWETPFKGEILGRNGYRRFFIQNDVIYVILVSRTSTFCANETRNPNYHHKVIRQAIEAGKKFEPSAFKQRAVARGCPSPKYQTYWWKDADGRSCNLGQIYQNCDGWWWAWASQGDREGCNFQTQIQAQKYLEIERAIALTEIAALAQISPPAKVSDFQHSHSSAIYELCECGKCKVPEVEAITRQHSPVTADEKVLTEKQTLEIVGVLAMKEEEENAIARALPFPQPRFWFGIKVVHTKSWQEESDLWQCYWQVGTITGMNWNPESCQWQYMVFWEEDSEESDKLRLGYNNDQLLMSERDLYYA